MVHPCSANGAAPGRRTVGLALLAACAAAWPARPAPAGATFRAEANFPGGAADIVRIDPNAATVRFRIPNRPGWRAWWYLRVSGAAPGRTVRLELDRSGAKCTAGRAVYSADGKTWHFTAPPRRDPDARNVDIFVQKLDTGAAAFAWYVPHVPADANALAAAAEKRCPDARRFELCRSEDGLPVVGVRIGRPEDKKFAVWVQGRQHAWELVGSWTAHGLAEWAASDEPRAKALRAVACVTIVPIMDTDGAAKGEGGKDRRPHDHNRDWSAKPHWKSVAAAQAELKRLDAAGKLRVFLDLHDPGWGARGPEFWCSQFDKMPDERKAATRAFLGAVEAEFAAGRGAELWPFSGLKQPTYIIGQPYAGGWTRANMRQNVVCGTFEIPVGPPGAFKGDPPASHLAFGRVVGLTIERFLRAAR